MNVCFFIIEVLIEEVQFVFVENKIVFIVYGRLGFFVNNINDIKGVICNWIFGYEK